MLKKNRKNKSTNLSVKEFFSLDLLLFPNTDLKFVTFFIIATSIILVLNIKQSLTLTEFPIDGLLTLFSPTDLFLTHLKLRESHHLFEHFNSS